MLPNETEWCNFYGKLYKQSGLDLKQYKAQQMQRRILTMAEHKKLTGLDDLWEWISAA